MEIELFTRHLKCVGQKTNLNVKFWQALVPLPVNCFSKGSKVYFIQSSQKSYNNKYDMKHMKE